MTSHDLARLGRRWWWVMVICPLLAAGLAYLVSSTLTPLYRADSTVVIQEASTTSGGTYNEIIAAERRTATFSRLAQARPVLEETIQRLGLPLDAHELAEDVSVTPVQDTQLITISVTDRDPALAASIANTIAQVFINQIGAQQSEITGTSRDDLQRSIDTLRTQIDEITAEITEFQQRPDAGSEAVQSEILARQSQLIEYQATYGTLLESLQRMDIAEAQSRPQVRIVEPAIAPSEPFSPRTTLNTALGGILGLLLGGGVVALLGYLDNTIKNSDDLRRLTGSSAIGEVPQLRSKQGIEVLSFPHSQASEAYRGLRTNLQFASLGRDVRSIVVTSAQPGEGKSTTAANLAAVVAQGGKRVVIIDADLRKPRQHRLFGGLANRVGLTNVLLAGPDTSLDDFLQETSVPELRVLTTGPLPPNPPDLLNSQSMRDLVVRLKAHADIIFIDAPPMAVSDPLILAGIVDGVLLVTPGKKTRANVLHDTMQIIQRTGTTLIGVVVNRAQVPGNSYRYYRRYYESDRASDRRGSSRDRQSRRRFWRRSRDTAVNTK